MAPSPRKPWHRWFGILLADQFIGRPWSVAMEEELALKSQRLDILIIERSGAVDAAARAALAELPDGFDDLAAHNLLSYKSAAEPFNAWALEELVSHYVTYRKLVSLRCARPAAEHPDEPLAEPPGAYPLRPARDFRRYAIATREPRQLLRQLPAGAWRAGAQPGVYELMVGTLPVRLIVLDGLAQHPRNAPWGMFAHARTQTRYGLTHYRPRSDLGRFLRNQLAIGAGLEEIDMAYTVEDFRREAVKDLLDDPKSRHVLLGDVLADPKHLHALLGDVLADPKHLHALLGDVLADPKHLNALLGDVLADPKHLHALLERLVAEDRLRELTPEERLRGLDPDTIEAWLNEHRSRDH